MGHPCPGAVEIAFERKQATDSLPVIEEQGSPDELPCFLLLYWTERGRLILAVSVPLTAMTVTL